MYETKGIQRLIVGHLKTSSFPFTFEKNRKIGETVAEVVSNESENPIVFAEGTQPGFLKGFLSGLGTKWHFYSNYPNKAGVLTKQTMEPIAKPHFWNPGDSILSPSVFSFHGLSTLCWMGPVKEDQIKEFIKQIEIKRYFGVPIIFLMEQSELWNPQLISKLEQLGMQAKTFSSSSHPFLAKQVLSTLWYSDEFQLLFSQSLDGKEIPGSIYSMDLALTSQGKSQLEHKKERVKRML